MSRPDGRIEPGQRVASAISARAWNRAQDAADVVLGERPNFAAAGPRGPGYAVNIVLIRNDSGSDVDQFGVLGISGVAIDPTDSEAHERSFVEQPVLTGVAPLVDEHADRFVVTIEPIKDGSIGRAAVAGVFACKVQIVSASHRYATVKNADTTQLRSSTCGLVQLLWQEPDTGENKWALGAM